MARHNIFIRMSWLQVLSETKHSLSVSEILIFSVIASILLEIKNLNHKTWGNVVRICVLIKYSINSIGIGKVIGVIR